MIGVIGPAEAGPYEMTEAGRDEMTEAGRDEMVRAKCEAATH